MASTTAMPVVKPYPPPYSLMNYHYPPVFKRFLLDFVKSLSIDDRAAFKLWCKGVVPSSKLDINMATDGDAFTLIDFLLDANALSLTDLSLLEKFLSIVGRYDLLQALQEVELRISIGIILEDYIKSVNGFRHGAQMKLVRSYANIVNFLLATKAGNQELISLVLKQLRQVEDDSKILEIINSAIPVSSQLSWSTITSSLVTIGEFYASFSRPDPEVLEVAADGYYVCLVSETDTSELLTRWMLKNGGLKAFKEFIKEKQQVTISESVLSSIGESLKENIKLLGNRVDIQ